MLTKDAIQELSQAEAISAAEKAITKQVPAGTLVGLTDNFTLHVLEQYMPNRRRARGSMSTPNVGDFAKYVADNKEVGAAVFVQQDKMTAIAVLNLGTPTAPGHTDNTAKLEPKKTAAYIALKRMANGEACKQQAVAEFFEDWALHLKFFNENGEITPAQAVAAVRKISIESLKKMESEEAQLSASKGVFESVSVANKDLIPTRIKFTTVPFHGLNERVFTMRLGILSSSDKAAINLRIINQEQHDEEMAAELAALVATEVKDLPIMIGEYAARS